MDLVSLAQELRNYIGVVRKRRIGTLVKEIEKVDSPAVLASFGEDTGVIELGDRAILFSAEGIWDKIVKKNPYWAGYCSVIVNVNDTLAMGGKPLAIVDVIASSKEEVYLKMARGLKDASEKYGVPIVSGHFHPDTEYDMISAAIIGETDKDSVIYSHTAREGDYIIMAIDLRGKLHPDFEFNWDSITDKRKDEIKGLIRLMEKLGEARLVSAGKDISNPGIIGTLAMLCETSGVGAIVNINRVPRPFTIDIPHWLKVYPGYGFILTASEENISHCLKLFREEGINAEVVGRVEREMKVIISDGRKKEVVFDLEKDRITGTV
jgi:hypothetical protein